MDEAKNILYKDHELQEIRNFDFIYILAENISSILSTFY